MEMPQSLEGPPEHGQPGRRLHGQDAGAGVGREHALVASERKRTHSDLAPAIETNSQSRYIAVGRAEHEPGGRRWRRLFDRRRVRRRLSRGIRVS